MTQKAQERSAELLRDAIDLHVHTAPCPLERPWDDLDLAREAERYRLRAVVLKDHHSPTGARAYHVRRHVSGIEVYGAIVLNAYCGGLNPYAVEAELKYYGAKVVWFPTVTAAEHLRVFGKPSFPGQPSDFLPVRGIRILGENGRLRDEVYDILQLIREHNAILATGHIARDELRVLVSEARRARVERIVVTHANFVIPGLTPEEQRELADQGAYIEHCYLPLTPVYFRTSAEDVAKAIRAVGPHRVVLSSDLGVFYAPSPPEGLRCFAESLLVAGVSLEDLDRMMKRNPAELLGLSAGRTP